MCSSLAHGVSRRDEITLEHMTKSKKTLRLSNRAPGTDAKFHASLERKFPNAVTRQAIEEVEQGRLRKFSSVDDALRSLGLRS